MLSFWNFFSQQYQVKYLILSEHSAHAIIKSNRVITVILTLQPYAWNIIEHPLAESYIIYALFNFIDS